jgi:hypothetical protein
MRIRVVGADQKIAVQTKKTTKNATVFVKTLSLIQSQLAKNGMKTLVSWRIPLALIKMR